MTELEELEDIVGSLENIEPFGIEPDYSSLGLEPAEVLGFHSEEELEHAIQLLTVDMKDSNLILFDKKINQYQKQARGEGQVGIRLDSYD